MVRTGTATWTPRWVGGRADYQLPTFANQLLISLRVAEVSIPFGQLLAFGCWNPENVLVLVVGFFLNFWCQELLPRIRPYLNHQSNKVWPKQKMRYNIQSHIIYLQNPPSILQQSSKVRPPTSTQGGQTSSKNTAFEVPSTPAVPHEHSAIKGHLPQRDSLVPGPHRTPVEGWNQAGWNLCCQSLDFRPFL